MAIQEILKALEEQGEVEAREIIDAARRAGARYR